MTTIGDRHGLMGLLGFGGEYIDRQELHGEDKVLADALVKVPNRFMGIQFPWSGPRRDTMTKRELERAISMVYEFHKEGAGSELQQLVTKGELSAADLEVLRSVFSPIGAESLRSKLQTAAERQKKTRDGAAIGELPVTLVAQDSLHNCADTIARTFGKSSERLTVAEVDMALQLLEPYYRGDAADRTAVRELRELERLEGTQKKSQVALDDAEQDLRKFNTTHAEETGALANVEGNDTDLRVEIEALEAYNTSVAVVDTKKVERARLAITRGHLEERCAKHPEELTEATRAVSFAREAWETATAALNAREAAGQSNIWGHYRPTVDAAAELNATPKLRNLEEYKRLNPIYASELHKAASRHGRSLFLRLRANRDFTIDNVTRLKNFFLSQAGDVFDADDVGQLGSNIFEETLVVGRDVGSVHAATKLARELDKKFDLQPASGFDRCYYWDGASRKLKMGILRYGDLARYAPELHRVLLPRTVDSGLVELSLKEAREKKHALEAMYGPAEIHWRETPVQGDAGMVTVQYDATFFENSAQLVGVFNETNRLWMEGFVRPNIELVETITDKLEGLLQKQTASRINEASQHLAESIGNATLRPGTNPAKTLEVDAGDNTNTPAVKLAALAGVGSAVFGAATGNVQAVITTLGISTLLVRPALKVATALAHGHQKSIIYETLGVAYNRPLDTFD